MKHPELRNLRFMWLAFPIMVLGLGFISSFSPVLDDLRVVPVLVHSSIVLAVLASLPVKARTLLVWAFLVRLIVMLWDLYAQHLYELPNSGADTEFFFHQAINVSNDLSLLDEPIRGGLYVKMLGLLFSITGSFRLAGHYVNVLAGLMVVVTVYKITKTLGIKPGVAKVVLVISAFFPNSLIMSGVLLREIIPTFLVAQSLLYLVYWYKFGGKGNVVKTLLMLTLASAFHSGVMGLFVGYAFMFLFYKHQTNSFSFGFQTIVAFLLIGGFGFLATTQFGDFLFGKFEHIEEIEDIFESANRRFGASVYLVGMEVTNFGQFLLYGPIKMIFFISSPIPFDWRSHLDVFTFLFDSSLYIITLFYIVKNRRFFGEHKKLLTALTITLFAVWFLFGIGVSNAGTAMRHRQKFVPVTVIVLGIMKNAPTTTQIRQARNWQNG